MFWRRRSPLEQDLDRELRSHLEMEAAEHGDDGRSFDEARYAARRSLGNTTMLAEEMRQVWTWTAVEQVWHDLRYGARTLARAPGFTIATVLTLALGIGANSAMFSIVRAVILKPLAFDRPEQLIEIYSRDAQNGRGYVSQPNLDDWSRMTHSFSGLASWVPQSVNLTGLEQPERITGMFVSSNFFAMLRVAPAIGRGFAPGGDRIGAESVAVISDGLWRSRFGSSPGILGTVAEFNGEPYTIVGVLPPSFTFPFADADVFLPAFKYPNYSMDRARSSCAVIGRLRDGVSILEAQSEMDAVAARLAAAYPSANRGTTAHVVPMKDDLIEDLRPSIAALAGAVAFVLLIGCANVAGLFIARMTARERERTVRIALGASRTRLLSHLLAESGLLAIAGGGLGFLITVWSIPAIASSAAAYLPYGMTISVDRDVVAFTLGISLAAAILIALIPAFQCPDPQTLRTGRGAAAKACQNPARGMLVATEVALSLVLLAGAGLLIRSFSELSRATCGFDTHNLLTLAYRVPRNKYPSPAQQARFHQDVVDRIKAQPGVLAATSVRAVPLGGNGGAAEFLLANQPEPPAAERPQALLNFADPGFFSTLRIPVLKGRVFTEHDVPGSSFVLVINQTLARRYFDGRDPVGQRLRIPSIGRTGEIVGVVGDVKQFTLRDPAAPQIYGVLAQNPFLFTSLAVRTAGDPMKMVNQIRRSIWQVDKDQPVWSVHTFDEILATQARLRGLIAALLSGYALIALLLAATGIFGVISYAVSRRTAEIGVRMALGAGRSQVLWLMLRQSLRTTLYGILIGIPAALMLLRVLKTLLYGVRPADPLSFAAAVIVMMSVSAVAAWIPARRASRLDPVVTLRQE